MGTLAWGIGRDFGRGLDLDLGLGLGRGLVLFPGLLVLLVSCGLRGGFSVGFRAQ